MLPFWGTPLGALSVRGPQDNFSNSDTPILPLGARRGRFREDRKRNTQKTMVSGDAGLGWGVGLGKGTPAISNSLVEKVLQKWCFLG